MTCQRPWRKTESVNVDREMTVFPDLITLSNLNGVQRSMLLSRAGAILGRLRLGYRANRARRKPRRWTGWLGRERVWFGRLVLLPDGRTVGSICAVIRQNAVVRVDDAQAEDGVRFVLIHASELRLVRLNAAVILGRSKLGCREKPSPVKRAAARLNGSRPARPGRLRGRPRILR
jgi:hypothetical protein